MCVLAEVGWDGGCNSLFQNKERTEYNKSLLKYTASPCSHQVNKLVVPRDDWIALRVFTKVQPTRISLILTKTFLGRGAIPTVFPNEPGIAEVLSLALRQWPLKKVQGF